jgi:hypothetical protein
MKAIVATCFLCAATCSAGDFINLTFDNPRLSGTLTPLMGFDGLLTGDVSDLYPGWS